MTGIRNSWHAGTALMQLDHAIGAFEATDPALLAGVRLCLDEKGDHVVSGAEGLYLLQARLTGVVLAVCEAYQQPLETRQQ